MTPGFGNRGCNRRCLLFLFALEKPLDCLLIWGAFLPAEPVELCQQDLAGLRSCLTQLAGQVV